MGPKGYNLTPGDQAYIRKRYFPPGEDSVRPHVHVHVHARLRILGVRELLGHFAPPGHDADAAVPLETRRGPPRPETCQGLPGPGAPRPPLLPPAGCLSRAPRALRASASRARAGARLPLGDIKDPAGGRARRPLTLGFPIADQVLEKRAAREQAGRH